MNTYSQDETIPIYITLQYGINILKFPVNPETLEKQIQSSSEIVEIEGIGEVSIPKKPKLATMTLKSFFWHEVNLLPSSVYIAWLEKWQRSGKPAKLIVTRFNYSMDVTCEDLRHTIKAGEEKDIYFEIDLKEFRPYGAKKLNVISNMNLLTKLQKIKDLVTPPVLVEIPRPTRVSISKQTIYNPYTTKKNETVLTICKKITGSTNDWKELFDCNTEVLSELFVADKEIPSGTKLQLPRTWAESEKYNIVSVE